MSQSRFQKNEIYGGYGFASLQEISTVLASIVIIPITFGTVEPEYKSPVGPIMFGYKSYTSEHVSLGLSFSYAQFDQVYTSTINKSMTFTLKNYFVTMMGRLDYYYNPNNIVQLYSGGAFGISSYRQTSESTDPTAKTESASKIIPAGQLNVVGIRAGRDFAGYLELGFGFNGVVNGGISVKF